MQSSAQNSERAPAREKSTELAIQRRAKHIARSIKYFDSVSFSPSALLDDVFAGMEIHQLAEKYHLQDSETRYAINLAYDHPECTKHYNAIRQYAFQLLNDGNNPAVKNTLKEKYLLNDYSLELYIDDIYPSKNRLAAMNSPLIIEQIKNDRLANMTPEMLSKKYNTSLYAINKILKSLRLNSREIKHRKHARIIELAAEGKTFDEISQTVGLLKGTVATIIRKAAVNGAFQSSDCPDGIPPCMHEKKLRNQAMIKDAQNGASMEEITHKYHVSKCLAYDILAKGGYRYNTLRQEKRKAVCDLFLQGASIYDVSRELGYSVKWVSMLLAREGIDTKAIRERNKRICLESKLHGATISSIAAKYDIPEETVLSIINYATRRHTKAKHSLSPAAKNKIIEKICEGTVSHAQIAEDFQVNLFSISKLINEAKNDGRLPVYSDGKMTPYRTRKAKQLAERNANIMQAFERGESDSTIAQTYGLTVQYVNYLKHRFTKNQNIIATQFNV